MSKVLLISLVMLGAGVAAHAGTGDLTYVDADPQEAMKGPPASYLVAMDKEVAKADADAGTVSKDAVVATFSTGLKVAIDSAKAEDKQFSVARFDFTGKGKFGDDCVVPLKTNTNLDAPKGVFYCTIGPAKLKVKQGERTVPAIVYGQYAGKDDQQRVFLILCAAAEGQCAFGDKTYKVRVADGNGNLKLNDPAAPSFSRYNRDGVSGDRVMIYAGEGAANPAAAKVAYPEGRVQVDGAWYEIAVTEDLKIAAKAVKVETGSIKIDHPSWTAKLVGRKQVIDVSGGAEPVAVPADTYVIAQYEELVQGAAEARTLFSSGIRGADEKQVKPFEVAAGKTVEVAAGSPLTVSLGVEQAVKQEARSADLSLQVVDTAGCMVNSLLVKSNTPPAPKFEVLDSAGKRVYAGDMVWG